MNNPLQFKSNFMYPAVLLLLFWGLGGQTAMASHIPGANITYTCNPANPLEYTFTFTMFRRCPGTHPSTVSAFNFSMTNNCGHTNPTIPTFNQVGTAVDVNQLCSSVISNCNGGTEPGVWMYTYEATVILPADCDAWTLAFELCCRDASSNLNGGSGNDMACSTTMNTLTAPCNNSPVVTSAPIPYACTNQPFSYCLTTADPEGDSIAYRMVAPAGNAQVAIGHQAGFTVASPLNGFVLNPQTGCFTFNHPNVGNYVVAIAIEEYDMFGNLKSEIIHDFQVQVVNCTNTAPAPPTGGITNVSGTGGQTGTNSVAVCLGQSICFDVTFSDPNPGDILTITSNATALFPGATFTQTGTNPVTGTFCWTATTGYTSTIATFTGEDDGCPVKGVTDFAVNIDIITGTFAGPNVNICDGAVQLNAIGGSTFNWSPAAGLSCTNCPNPVANPTSTTTYTVISNLSGACSNVDQVTVTVDPSPPTATISGNIGICNTGSNTLVATGGSNFFWSTGETTSTITVSPTVTTDYSVVVYNLSSGCFAYDTTTVVVAPAPDPNVQDVTVCNGNSFTLSAAGGGTYLWSTGATTDTLLVSPTVSTDYYVTVTLGSCTQSDTATVSVTPTSGPVMACRPDTILSACNAVLSFDTPIAIDYCAPQPCISNSLSNVLTALTTNGTTIAGNIPTGYNFSNGLTGTNISDGGNDMYDGGNYINTNITSNIPYTNNAVSTSTGFGAGTNNYFTYKVNNLWVMAADLNGVNSFNTSGNNGADGSGTANGFDYSVTVGCMNYYVFVKRINNAGNDPSINHVYIVPDNGTAPAPTHTWATNTNDDNHTLNGLANFDRLYYLLFAGTSGYAYTNAEVEAVVLDFIAQANTTGGGIGQAPVVQTTGLPSGSTFPTGTTTVTFQATGTGGVTTCSFDVIVQAGNGPLINCRPDTTVSECSPVVNFTAPIATDPCFASCSNASLASILSAMGTNGATIASNIPTGYNFSNGLTGTNISDGGNDMYDGGNYINTNITNSISYTNNALSTSTGFGVGTNNYFTYKINNLWVMGADLNGVNSFNTSGNNGADGSGTVNGFDYTVTVGCMTYYIFVKRINSAGNDPSINHVYIVPDNGTTPAPTHTWATNTNDDNHTLNGLANFDRLYYLLFAGTSGYAYTNAQVQAAVVDFLTQVSAATGIAGGGVTVSQIAGLPSGTSFPLGTNTITYRATSAISGLSSDCSFDIVVQPRPVANITGAPSTCSGVNTTLSATGGLSCLWSTGATTPTVVVAPTANTAYTVTVTDNLNCTDSETATVTIETPSTLPNLSPMPGTQCPNTTMTLSASGGTAGTGSTIEWYTGANGTGTNLGAGSTVNILPTGTTTYYVRREGNCNTTTDATVTVTLKDYIYALNATSTSDYCTDDAGWHHFFNGSEIYLSIQGDLTGAPTNFPSIAISDNNSFYQQTQGPFVPTSCASSNLTPGEERFEMERNWNVDFGGGTLNPPYNVRFYYEPAERTAIETAAAAHMAAYPACGYSYKYAYPQGFYWFKNTGSNYTAPDYDGLHLSSTTASTPSGINYDEMTGVTSFSGGTGAIILSPITLLPVQWLYFDGHTDNKTNFLRWATESEQNTVRFNIQRSKDAVQFTTIGMVAAQGVSTTTTAYTFDDENPLRGANYYRLELVDKDGKLTYSNAILLVIAEEGDTYTFYPNPTDDIVNYQYEARAEEMLEIKVIDVYGRTLYSNQMTSRLGLNQIPVSLADYPVGSYVLRINHLTSGNIHTTKVIKSEK